MVWVMRSGDRGGNDGPGSGSRRSEGDARAGDPGGGLADEGSRRRGDRREPGAVPAIDLSGSEATRAFAIYDESRRFLKDLESERAEVFAQWEDADGNSSSTLLLERPTPDELDQIFGDCLESMPAEDRIFVEKTGLSTQLRKEIADFFGYGENYRYVTFLLAGDGSATLPTVLILESDKLYDRNDTSQGRMDIPMDELRLREFADLKVGDPKLERYGRLFSIK